MRKWLIILSAALLLPWTPLFAEEWFDIEIRVMTTGENQPQREIGIFGAELPLSGKGYLEKSLTVRNLTRNRSNDVEFKISMKPERGTRGELHLIFTSDATPRIGKPESRFRDLLFDKPSGQIVEIFADPETGTRLLVALMLTTKEIKEELTADLRVVLKSRVERVSPSGREEIDSFDLQSVGRAPAGRTLTHSVPVWVPGEQAGDIKLEGLKDLDTATSTVTVKAGEGFTYTPEVSKKETRKKEREEKKRKKDNRIPTIYQPDKEKEEDPGETEKAPPAPEQAASEKTAPSSDAGQKRVEPSGSYNWEKENFTFEVSCEAEQGGTVRATVKMNGSIYDPETKAISILQEKEEAHAFANGEIKTFTLSDEAGAGYVLTIQAQF